MEKTTNFTYFEATMPITTSVAIGSEHVVYGNVVQTANSFTRLPLSMVAKRGSESYTTLALYVKQLKNYKVSRPS